MARNKSVQELDIAVPANRRGGCYPCFLTIVLVAIAVIVMVFPLLTDRDASMHSSLFYFKGTLLGWLSMIGMMTAILCVIIIDQITRRRNLRCCNAGSAIVGILFVVVVVPCVFYFIPHADAVISTLSDMVPANVTDIAGEQKLNHSAATAIINFFFKLSCEKLDIITDVDETTGVQKNVRCANGFNVVFKWFMDCGITTCDLVSAINGKPNAGYLAIVYLVSYAFMLLVLVTLICAMVSCYRKPKDRIITMRVKCVGDDFKAEVVKKTGKK